MPTKRIALALCVSLLAACAPRAVDSPAGDAAAAPATAPMAAAAQAAGPEVTTATEATAPEPPDALQALERARANAGCPVSEDVYDLDDIRIYCTMPEDVRAFLARENTCQHFAGEEPYDEERRRELDAANQQYCEGREQIFADLFARHHADCGLRQALIGVGTRYDLFTDTASDHCRPQDLP